MINITKLSTEDLEKKLHQGLLKYVTNGIVGVKSEFGASILVELVNREVSLEGKELTYIKAFTKGARVIRGHDGRLEDNLELVYDYNMLGVKVAREGSHNEPVEDVIKMEAHMMNDAGILCSDIYDKTKDMGWLEKGFQHIVDSSTMLRDVEPKESVQILSFGADMAKKLYQETNDFYWGKLAHDQYMEVVKWSWDVNGENIGSTYLHAGFMAEKLYKQTEDVHWAEMGIKALLQAEKFGMASTNMKFVLYNAMLDISSSLEKKTGQNIYRKLRERYENRLKIAQTEIKNQ
jgi:hypothetical protein